MRAIAWLAVAVLVAGCGQPVTGAPVEVAGYLVSRDSDLNHAVSDGGSQTVTCTGDMNVHLVILDDAGDWTNRAHWQVLVGKRSNLAFEVDVWGTTVYVYSCLAPGEVVSSLRYQAGSEVLATAVVDIEPTATS